MARVTLGSVVMAEVPIGLVVVQVRVWVQLLAFARMVQEAVDFAVAFKAQIQLLCHACNSLPAVSIATMIGLRDDPGASLPPPNQTPALVAKVFAEGGWLQNALKLDHRPQQEQMASAVAPNTRLRKPIPMLDAVLPVAPFCALTGSTLKGTSVATVRELMLDWARDQKLVT